PHRLGSVRTVGRTSDLRDRAVAPTLATTVGRTPVAVLRCPRPRGARVVMSGGTDAGRGVRVPGVTAARGGHGGGPGSGGGVPEERAAPGAVVGLGLARLPRCLLRDLPGRSRDRAHTPDGDGAGAVGGLPLGLCEGPAEVARPPGEQSLAGLAVSSGGDRGEGSPSARGVAGPGQERRRLVRGGGPAQRVARDDRRAGGAVDRR